MFKATRHEIVTGDQADLLPVGSVIVHVDGDWPLTRRGADAPGWWSSAEDTRPCPLSPASRFRVLLVPAGPPPPPARVGDRVQTLDEIMRLPARTILMDSTGTAIQLWHDADSDTRLWWSAEADEPRSDIEMASIPGSTGYAVIWLPALAAVTGPEGWLVAETSCPGGC